MLSTTHLRGTLPRVLAATVAGALLLAGCGGDDAEVDVVPTDQTGTTAEPTTPAGTTAEPTTATMPPEEQTAAAPPVQLQGEVNNHGTAALQGDTLEMEQDDFYFEPTFVSHEDARTVTVRLHNEGDTAHTFTIEDQAVDEVVEPGETAEVELRLPDSGTTRFVCRFHESQGMQGAFFVEQGGG